MQESLATIPMEDKTRKEIVASTSFSQLGDIVNAKELTADLPISGDCKKQFRMSVKNSKTAFATNMALGFMLGAAFCFNSGCTPSSLKNDVSMCFSPDGTRLAIGSRDKTVKLRDPATGEVIHTLKGHSGVVWSVCFSSDGTRIASGSQDKTIKLWDAATGEELHTLKGHSDVVSSVCFSRDGTRIATGSQDKTVKLWDAATGKELRTLKGHEWSIRSVCFSPDGTRIMSTGSVGKMKLWDAATGELIRSLGVRLGHPAETLTRAR